MLPTQTHGVAANNPPKMSKLTPGARLARLFRRIREWRNRVWGKVQCADCLESDNQIGADGLCHFCAEDRALIDQRERR